MEHEDKTIEDAGLNFVKGVNASFGGWSEREHPQLDGKEGIDNYVREMRKGRTFQMKIIRTGWKLF